LCRSLIRETEAEDIGPAADGALGGEAEEELVQKGEEQRVEVVP
jgi:hypothetical protein